MSNVNLRISSYKLRVGETNQNKLCSFVLFPLENHTTFGFLYPKSLKSADICWQDTIPWGPSLLTQTHTPGVSGPKGLIWASNSCCLNMSWLDRVHLTSKVTNFQSLVFAAGSSSRFLGAMFWGQQKHQWAYYDSTPPRNMLRKWCVFCAMLLDFKDLEMANRLFMFVGT